MKVLVTLLAVVLSSASFSLEAPLDERVAAHQSFKRSFEAGQYIEALPLAMRVIELTTSQYGAESTQLLNPLTNLATTYYRLAQHERALDTYRAALALMDQETDNADIRLVRPLHGLGATLRALQRDEEAAVPLKRAVDIIRNREGLYSQNQLPLLGPLAASYTNSLKVQEAGDVQQYALSIAENSFGRNDLRLLKPLDDYARWNESVGRFSLARVLHVRALQLSETQAKGGLEAVPAMRGIARTHRLAFINGESQEDAAAATQSQQLSDSMLQRALAGPSSEGERVLRTASERLRTADPPRPQEMADVLLDLGDWYQTGGSSSRAMVHYREAWNIMNIGGLKPQLTEAVPLTYRPPSVAVSRGPQDPEKFEQQYVELRLSIEPDGEVREASVVNPTADRESVERAVSSALRRSRFRPIFVDGAPVAATDIAFRERVYVKRPESG